MCSRSSSTESIPQKTNSNLINDACRKCSMKASVVLQSKFSYCRDCFLEYFKHKFRATLGKSKIMKHGDKILIAFSGSASCTCLIDLIRDSLNDGNKKKMSFNICVLFIDERAAYNSDNKQPNIHEISDIIAPFSFPMYSTNLGAYLANDLDLDCNNLYKKDERYNDVIRELFQKFRTTTSKMDLLLKIRNNILFKVALKLGCQKIFSAETNDHLAVNTIANIVQGRGGQLPQDIGFCDNRHKEVILIRPLQDCSRKEVAYYNVFNNLTSLTSVSFCTKGDKYSSIQRLSETFISDLQRSFPSTVLTVRGTGSKLSSANSINRDMECCLCQGKIDQSKRPLTAYQASHLSKLVSKLGPSEFDGTSFTTIQSTHECCASCSCSSQNCSEDISLKTFLERRICYGCDLILKDSDSLETLPKMFLTTLQEKYKFNQMYDEIKTFLL